VPFTPVTGHRLLVADGPEAETRRSLLARAGATLVEKLGVSSLNVTFATEEDWKTLGAAGYLQRTDQQYHFVNEGYRDFDDFLGALASRKRKAIKRERRDALLGGVEIELLTGSDLNEDAWDAFFHFYMDTGSRKWGRPYLNRTFFSLVGERMADKILLVLARRNGRPIAGALNFIGSDTLYGRNWGTIDDQPFLHFELCYYQAIEWAIDHGLQLTSRRMSVALGVTGLQRLVIRLVGKFPGISAGQVATILHLDPSTVTPPGRDLTATTRRSSPRISIPQPVPKR